MGMLDRAWDGQLPGYGGCSLWTPQAWGWARGGKRGAGLRISHWGVVSLQGLLSASAGPQVGLDMSSLRHWRGPQGGGPANDGATPGQWV